MLVIMKRNSTPEQCNRVEETIRRGTLASGSETPVRVGFDEPQVDPVRCAVLEHASGLQLMPTHRKDQCPCRVCAQGL